jgi:hypothetical protein
LYQFVNVALGGLVVSVSATGSKVRGFKSGRGRYIFKVDKIRITTSFGGEIKPSVPFKILRHVKEQHKYEKRYSVGIIHGHF